MLKPGTYSLPAHHKVIEVVDTNVQQVRGQGNAGVKETFRAEQVEFVLDYEYGFWYVRDTTAKAAEDDTLSENVLKAFERYDKIEQRYGAVQQRISQAIERIGRSFRARHIASCATNPCDVLFVNGLLENVRDVPRNPDGGLESLPDSARVTDLSPSWNGRVRVDNDGKLLLLFAKYLMYVVNREIREFGMEVTEFFIKDIPHKRPELQVRAEKAYEAELLIAAVHGMLKAKKDMTPEEAMLIALGQDEKYAGLVTQTKWQELVRDLVGQITVENVVRVIDALHRAKRVLNCQHIPRSAFDQGFI